MNAEIRRILCATDLSGNCDHIYSHAMNLAGERDAGLMVIHVISQRSIKAAKMLAYFLNEGQKDIVKEKTYSALQGMKEQLTAFLDKNHNNHPACAGLVEHMLVYPGKVAEEIVEKASRFKVHNPAATLGDIAASKATSGLGVYAVIKKLEPKPETMKPGSVWTPAMVEEAFAGAGVGRKSIGQIIKGHGLDKKTVYHRLKESGIEAADDDKIKKLADKHDSTPIRILTIILIDHEAKI